MKTFLLPVDFSAVSEEIVDTTVALAGPLGGKVALLHVVQPPVLTSEYALSVIALEEAMTAGEKSAAKKLEKYVTTFRQAGIECESQVRQGLPLQIIAEEAKRTNCDCIVMGSHGHGKIYDLLIGSTASGVLKRAQCAVLILPPKDKHH